MLSRDARIMVGLTLLLVPTIQWGGLTVLAIVTGGVAGAPFAPPGLTPAQQLLYTAGHGHAGVLTILSLVIQIALDSARLGAAARWMARIAAPVAGILVSGGFFGLAHAPALRILLYLGAALLALALITTGIGLLRGPAPASPRR
jgi:hypothetical protein